MLASQFDATCETKENNASFSSVYLISDWSDDLQLTRVDGAPCHSTETNGRRARSAAEI
jgi:hypothetical protein